MTAPANAVQVQGQGSVSADQANTFVQGCSTAAMLRGFIGAAGMSVYLYGIAAPEDGSGGFFQWFPNSTSSDDNKNVIRPSGVSQGAWVRDQLFTPITPTPQQFGAVGNGKILDDGAITGGLTSFSSATAVFTSGDVGKSIAVIGAGISGATLITTIASVPNSTTVGLTAAAGTSVSNAHFAYGTDDSLALAAFFTAFAGKSASFQQNSVYISSTKQSCQLKELNAWNCPIVFMIGNNTDNAFSAVMPQPLDVSQITSRVVYYSLYIDCMATGLDGYFQHDGSACLYSFTVDYPYRDAIMLNPSSSDVTAIENFTIFDCILRHVGRHGVHGYISGNGLSQVCYINETNIHAMEMRGLGQRFSGANAIRFTFDNVTMASASKIGVFNTWGGNWDCDQAATLGGNSIGSVVYVEAINGTTYRRVEFLRIINPGGIESTTGTVSATMFLNGTSIVAGDIIQSRIDQGDPFNWGFGVPSVYFTIADANVYNETSPLRGSVLPAVIMRPAQPLNANTTITGSLAIVSANPQPGAGMIDPQLVNTTSVFATLGTLVASSNLTVTIPIRPLNPAGNIDNTWAWSIIVILDHKPSSNTPANWAYAKFEIQTAYEFSPGPTGPFINPILTVNVPSGNPLQTFTPSAVTFTITSSTGSICDQLNVIIPGGSSVGSGGINTLIDVIAFRAAAGINEWQHNFGAPGLQVNMPI